MLGKINRLSPLKHLRKIHSNILTTSSQKRSIFSREIHNYHIIVEYNKNKYLSQELLSSSGALLPITLCYLVRVFKSLWYIKQSQREVKKAALKGY